MITRVLTALLLAAALMVVANFLHIISIAYLAGLASGLALGMVMWFRFSR